MTVRPASSRTRRARFLTTGEEPTRSGPREAQRLVIDLRDLPPEGLELVVRGLGTVAYPPDRVSKRAAATAPAGDQRRSNARRDAHIVRRFEAGETLQAIANHYDLTRERVRQIVNRAGAHRPFKNAADRFAVMHGTEIDELFEAERDADTTADRLGLSRAKVREYLRHAGCLSRSLPRVASAKQQFSDEDLIAIAREAAGSKRALTGPAYAKWRQDQAIGGRHVPSLGLFTQRFGTWRASMAKAGLVAAEPRRGYVRRFDTDHCLNAVGLYLIESEELGQRATNDGYEAWARSVSDAPSAGTVRNRLGSWASALRRAHEYAGR